ncbi:MAG: cobalt ECF transporter T component CbiQ [Anaerolineae bacterium]
MRYLPDPRGESPIHQASAGVKLALTLAYIVAVNLTPQGAWPIYALHALMVVVVLVVARLPGRAVMARLAVAAPFLLLALLGLPFTPGGHVVATIRIEPYLWAITDTGVRALVTVIARGGLSLLAAIVLGLTTPFADMVRAAQRAGLPAELAQVLLLMYRYLDLLVDEAQRLIRARAARSVAEPTARRAGGTILWRARITGTMIGTLFLRAYERSERVYQAMLARGFDGEIRTLSRMRPTRAELVAAAAGMGLVLCTVLIGHLRW